MGRPSKLESSGRCGDVRKLAAKGLTSREIAKELAADGFKISYVSIARFLKDEVVQHRVTARAVIAKETAKTVPLYTSAAKAVMGKALKGLQNAQKEGDKARWATVALQAATLLHKMTAGDGEADAAASVNRLGDRIASIVAERRKREE